MANETSHRTSLATLSIGEDVDDQQIPQEGSFDVNILSNRQSSKGDSMGILYNVRLVVFPNLQERRFLPIA
jgi:hypothetical protein